MTMMRVTTIILFFCLIPLGLSAQVYKIGYNHTISFDVGKATISYVLETDAQRSLYYMTGRKLDIKERDRMEVVNHDNKPFVSKNYSNKSMVSNQPIFSNMEIVEEKLPAQRWTIMDERKEIASFSCRKATTVFKGRNYTAWYSEEFSALGGPWKFDGLPGMILEVRSDDGKLEIIATKVEKLDGQVKDVFYNRKNVLSWSEYAKKFRETIDRKLRDMRADADDDVEYDMSVNMIEDIYEKE
jgi:GLPGLI family protein